MHGVHLSAAQSMQQAILPAAKTVEKTGVAHQSFGLTWAKAVQAGAVVSAQKVTMPQRKRDAAAADLGKPEDAVEQDQASDSNALSKKPATVQDSATKDIAAKTANDEISDAVEASLPILAQAAQQTVLAEVVPAKANAPMAKGVSEKEAAIDGKKHKASIEGDKTVETDATPQPDVAATLASVVLPVPAVTQRAADTAPVQADAKSVAKVEAAPAKRDRSAVVKSDSPANSDGVPKAGGDESKQAAEMQEMKIAPVAEIKAKTVEAEAVTSHGSMPILGPADAHGAATQASVAFHPPTVAHGAESSMARDLTDAQHSAPAMNSDGNAAQTLSMGPGKLEIGVLDSTHGWLKIRAELGTDGSVSASLTSSATAHEGLRDTVPAMSGYLESESLHVSDIAVHRAPEAMAAETDLANTGGGSASRDGNAEQGYLSGDRTAQRAPTASSDTQQNGDAMLSGASAAVFAAGARFGGDGIGSWLSVTA